MRETRRADREGFRDDAAVVGMSCIFPKAGDVEGYWQNILDKVDAVSDPPAQWEAPLYHDPEGRANDRVYCVRGGYLDGLARFDPLRYGVMPNSVDGTEPDHFLALRAASEALSDAGCLEKGFDRRRCEVIIGRGTYVNRGNAAVIQHGVVVDQVIRILKQLHPEHGDEELSRIKTALKESLPPFHSETAAGLVPNIISGRIANRLDLQGANYIIDAACASSLVAVDLAVRDLLSGRCDLAVAGGVHASTPPPIVMIFCQLNAISQSGRIRPFDARADGTLLGEGVGMVVLKRLADAQRDGDRIYAVVKGSGVASDGRAVGLLAPRLEGEVLALQRAYRESGVDPRSVGLIEAHGTATTVGDSVETQALKQAFGPAGSQSPWCALGSVKSMISHLMPASGIAGMIKAVLALHEKVLPPTIHCEQPNPGLELEGSPFYLNTETRPWIHGSPDAPRRAGVNAFGFGGINAHLILEECPDSTEASTFYRRWQSELCILSSESRGGLLKQCRKFLELLQAGGPFELRDLAFTLNTRKMQPCRLSLVAFSVDDLKGKLKRSLEMLGNAECRRIREKEGIYFFEEPLARKGRLAFAYPGEGSQYLNMLADLCLHFPQARRWFDLMDRAFASHPRRRRPSQTVFPPPLPASRQDDKGRQEQALWEMDSGAEAVFTANQAINAVLEMLGVRADAMVGHSTGEHSALLASGAIQVVSDEELIGHVLDVNGIFEGLQAQGEIPPGVLLAVGTADRNAVQRVVEESGQSLFVAMDNCPHQVILCGSPQNIAQAEASLKKKLAICQALPFKRAYHTPLFQVFTDPLRRYFEGLTIRLPALDLYNCVNCRPYRDAGEIRKLAARQWACTVRFRETILAMHEDGVRLFVEVGPQGHLTGFINDILRGKEFMALQADTPHRSSITQLHHLLGQLAAQGVSMSLALLYERRSAKQIDWEEPRSQPAPGDSARQIPLATGLQALRLPPDFQLREQPPAAPKAAGNASGSGLGPPSPSRPDAVSLVMEKHLQNMQEFLRSQQEVMRSLLGRIRPKETAPPAVPAGQGQDGPAPWPDGLAAFPFLKSRRSFEPGRRLAAEHEFDLQEDLLFGDHTLGRNVSRDDPALTGLPVVPLTITMEIMAECAAPLLPGMVLTGMRDVRAYKWITLEAPRTPIRIEAQVEGHPGEAAVQIHALDPDSRRVQTLLAEGVMLFEAAYPQAQKAGAFRLEQEAPSGWTPERLYKEGMFHGASFRAVRSMDLTGRDGTVATLTALPRQGLFRSLRQPRFLTDPVLLDAAGQVVAFWSREELERGFDIFPYQLESLTFYGPPRESGAELKCRVRAELLGKRQISSDIEIVDGQGMPYCTMKGWKDWRFELPARFLELRNSPRGAYLALPGPASLPGRVGDKPAACSRLECLDEELLQAHGAIWAKVLAHLILSRSEREHWNGWEAPLGRRCDWLLDRAAAKDAVRMLLERRFEVKPCPADIEIDGSGGKPFEAKGRWRESLQRPVRVAVARSGYARAAAAAFGDDSFGRMEDGLQQIAARALADHSSPPPETARVDGKGDRP